MRVHQAASSASSAREKWMRPLVVGPSPVITPSRTMVSACAAVWRPDGSGASDVSADVSVVLAVGAGIIALLNFFFQVQHFHTGHERAVNDSKLAFPDFWLPIGRCD